jgi:hypothetical protein
VNGELLRTVSLGEMLQDAEPIAASPANVARFHGVGGDHFANHIAIACLSGMILILDGADRIVSAVGGMPPVYVDGKLQQPESFNYTFNHPHDVYVDAAGSLYVAQ